ncbi:MAG: sulfotransferase, partial [Pseudomonadota bacterium]|nr:sulfotransferase [Pseudomonadota bacterium]
MNQGKIFGIGYPKTATSSLAKALALLDYRSVHDPYNILPRFFPEELKGFSSLLPYTLSISASFSFKVLSIRAINLSVVF